MKKLLLAIALSAILGACTKDNYITEQTIVKPYIVGAPAILYLNGQIAPETMTLDKAQHELFVKVSVTDSVHLDLYMLINNVNYREKYINIGPGNWTLSVYTDFIQYKSI